MAKRRAPRRTGRTRPSVSPQSPLASPPRIIGGEFRGRKLVYSGDLRTRPMKDRVREALFNLLGPAVRGTWALDLFAGTGAIGLEALSRGATRATFIERHRPTAGDIRSNVALLGVESRTELILADAIHWSQTRPAAGDERWLVLISPPFEFFVERREEMLALIARFIEWSPPGSLLAVESDLRFDDGGLPCRERWDVRDYPPARIAIWTHSAVK